MEATTKHASELVPGDVLVGSLFNLVVTEVETTTFDSHTLEAAEVQVTGLRQDARQGDRPLQYVLLAQKAVKVQGQSCICGMEGGPLGDCRSLGCDPECPVC